MIDNGYRMEVMDLEEIRCGDRVCHEGFKLDSVLYSLLRHEGEFV